MTSPEEPAGGDDLDLLFSPAPLAPTVVVLLDAGAAGVAAALLLMAALGAGGPARILLALAFVTFVPGWAVFGHLRLVEGLSRIALAVAMSLTLCTALAQCLLWLRRWDPSMLLTVLGAASLAILLAQLAWPWLAPRGREAR
jgi:hypothetical protein